MPMNKIYNFVYSLDSTKKQNNYCVEFSKFVNEEKSVLKFLDEIEYSPSQKVVDKVLDFARKTVAI